MFKHCMETVHNHGHLDWLFHWNIFPLTESTSIMSGNGKGFTIEELFRRWELLQLCQSLVNRLYSSFTKLWQSCSDPHPKISPIAIFAFSL